MAFAISYDIKAIDKFSAVADKVYASMAKMDRSMNKVVLSNKKAARSFQKMGTAAARNSKRINKSLTKTGKKANAAKNKFKELSGTINKVGTGMQSVGRRMTMGVTLPLAAVGAASIKTASDFESSMMDIQKITSKTMAGELRENIRGMTKEFPKTHVEIAKVTEDAIRFGIKGTANVTAFTKAVIKMSTATDVGVEDAGIAFAKIEELTGTSALQTENLGSAINSLQNVFATSGSEMVQSMLRSSAAMSNFGLSVQEITGLNAQMNAMSESSMRAGTRLRTLFNELQNPNKMKKYAAAIGMSAKEFKTLQTNSPIDAIMELVTAMNKGGKASENIRKIAGGESMQALTALSKNITKTKEALALSNTEFQKGTSLQRETDAVLGTSASKWKLMLNRMKDISITIGDKLIPIVERLVNKYLVPLVEWFENMDSATMDAGIRIAFFASAIGPVLGMLGGLVIVVSKVVALLGSAGGLGGVLAVLTGPVGWVIGAIIALTAFVSYFWKELRSLRMAIAGPIMMVFAELKGMFDGTGSSIKSLLGSIGTLVEFLSNLIAPFVAIAYFIQALPLIFLIKHLKIAIQIVRVIIGVFNVFVSALKYGFTWLGMIISQWLASTAAGRVIIEVFNGIKFAVMEVWNFITGLWDTTAAFFRDVANNLEYFGIELDSLGDANKLKMDQNLSASSSFTASNHTTANQNLNVGVDINSQPGQVGNVTQKSSGGFAKLNVGKNERI